MPRMIGQGLSRREREILDLLHELGPSSVNDVMDRLPDPPTYSAVRSVLRIMEEKGHVRHHEDGRKYLYSPTEAPQTAALAAMRQVLATFFGGSVGLAVKTMLSDREARISDQELAQLESLIEEKRREEEESQ